MAIIEITLKTFQQPFSLYDNSIEKAVSKKEYVKMLDKLDSYRNKYTEYAMKASEMKLFIISGIEEHMQTSQYFYEMASITVTHFELFIKLFNNYNEKKVETQKQLIIDVLDRGVKQMNATDAELSKSLLNFEFAFSALSVFKQHITNKMQNFEAKTQTSLYRLQTFLRMDKKSITNTLDAMDKVVRLCIDLAHQIEDTISQLAHARKMLSKEIEYHSVFLKTQIQEMLHFVNLDERPDLRNKAIESAQKHVEICENFQKNHKNSMETG